MRITDLPEEAGAVSSFKKANIYDSIKTQSKISNGQPIDEAQGESAKITAEVQGNKLKALLGQIKQS
jgi:hypothetical protein